VCIGQPGGFLDLGIGRFGPAIADVVADRAFEQVGLLRDIGQLLAQRLLGDVGYVLAVDQDIALPGRRSAE
jgi:hypothetical protein